MVDKEKIREVVETVVFGYLGNDELAHEIANEVVFLLLEEE